MYSMMDLDDNRNSSDNNSSDSSNGSNKSNGSNNSSGNSNRMAAVNQTVQAEMLKTLCAFADYSANLLQLNSGIFPPSVPHVHYL